MARNLGSKAASGAYQQIINLMPPHDCYIEAFLGGGTVMKRKAPAIRSFGLDLDERCLNAGDYDDGVTLIHDDALNWLRKFDFDAFGSVVVYCDPPYVKSTRSSNNRYRFEMTDDDHKKLLGLLKALPCHVMVSGYDNPIYTELVGHWWQHSFRSQTRGGVRIEKVWCNFEPGEMHYHTYTGNNASERQRIKRKADRMAKKIRALPDAERQAVVAAILIALNEP
ncbi:DNA adenine methylase [Vibrio fluvialis]|uniref:DNA adenine methylase n=1 Tax=Vibrio fluvialis TaxID=676 RepID=UPI00192B5E92|nr:DNA adenine methylase [Vibrio fluvialis]MBL4262840.1 DNA adenine methylase [Vibrio fluvialis]